MSAAANIVPGWYSLEGAAIYTGFSARSIQTAIELKQLGFQKVTIKGKGTRPAIRIRREDLDAWIQGGEQSTTPNQ